MEITKSEKVSIRSLKGINTESARKQRVEFLKASGMNTTFLEQSRLSAGDVKSNIESYVGSWEMPLGLVGPIHMQNDDGSLEKVMTLAGTTEGALVASMNRGASIINASGGFRAFVQKQKMLRAPVFCFEDLNQAKNFSTWIQSQLEFLRTHIKKYSSRAKLVEIKTNLFGRNVDCKFYYETADAAGQNMTTTCTWHCCLWIEKEFNQTHDYKITDFVLEGNGASDKKLSYGAIQNGRGIDVVAECVIPEELLRTRLKVSSEEIIKWFLGGCQITSYEGMVGNNINVANAITALFLSTGQDLACLPESSVGFLHFEKHEKGLYVNLKLPKLVIGSVGGGTGLPNAKAILELMGCHGAGKVERLAKLIAGFTLGLELSTISAMISGQFAIAHERLGRNKPINFLKQKELTNEFFTENRFISNNQTIQFIENLTENNGIITEVSAKNTNKYIGLSLWEVHEGNEKELAVLKSKTTADETLNCMYMLTGLIDPKLAKKFMLFQDQSEFQNCHQRELKIYESLKKEKFSGIPKIFGTFSDDDREIYIILMESLRADKMKLINSETNVDLWSDKDIENCIHTITKAHTLLEVEKHKDYVSKHSFVNYADFAASSISVIETEYAHKWSPLIKLMHNTYQFVAENEQSIYETLPTHIIHNDFNPRNIAISKEEKCSIYDWELACLDIPHRDIIELLLFTQNSKQRINSINNYFENHFESYRSLFKSNLSKEEWMKGYKFSFAKYIITRLNFYLLGHKLSHYDFLENVIKNSLKLNEEIFQI